MPGAQEKTRQRGRTALHIQLGVSAFVLGAALMAPPANGNMLVLPVLNDSTGRTAGWAVAAGGKILGTGRIPGSIVVTGERRRLFAAALRNGAVILAAPGLLCSAPRTSPE